MKSFLALSLVLITGSATAQIVIPETANVVSVTPLMEQSRTPGRCYQVQSQSAVQPGNNTGMAILGGIVGGAVGSQLGQGDGKLAATALGAGIGAVFGSGQPQQPQSRSTTQCEPDSIQSRVTGYHVVYNFRGNQSSAVLRNPPSGNTIQITITVDVPGNVANSTQQQYQQSTPTRF